MGEARSEMRRVDGGGLGWGRPPPPPTLWHEEVDSVQLQHAVNVRMASISAGMENGAKADSDHPAMQQASQGVLTQSAPSCGRSPAKRAPGPNDLGVRRAAAQGCGFPDDLRIKEELAGGGQGPAGWRTGARGPGADPGRRRLSGVLAEHSLIE